MPYTLKNLPDSTKTMPPHAKRIFMSAFNAASKQYDDESRAFAVAFAAVKKLYRQDKDGKWHRIKENMDAMKGYPAKKRRKKVDEMAEADMQPLDAETESWLTSQMAEIEEAALQEDDYEPPDPREEGRRMGIHSLARLLSCADHLDLSEVERKAITSMMTRLSTDLQGGMDESAPATDQALDLLAIQEVIEEWLVEQELREAGQRHRDEDYAAFDQVIEVIKRLRGQSPKELKAERDAADAERKDADPTEQMTQGYHAGEDAETPAAELELVAAESVPLQESISFLQEAGGDGRAWQVSVMQAGLSKNNRRYGLHVLTQAAPLFEGARVYVYDRLLKGKDVYDHLSDEEYRANPRGYAKDLVGYLKSPLIEGSRLVATLVLLPSGDWLRDNLREAFRQGKQDLYGLSIDAEGDGHWIESGGTKILEVDAIHAVTSVDVVSFPAAGGKFMRLVASVAIHAAEQEVLTVVESLRRNGQRLQFELTLHEVLDDLGIPVAAKRDARQRLLAALPL